MSRGRERTERLGDLLSLGRGERRERLGRWDPERVQKLNRLVFVDRKVAALSDDCVRWLLLSAAALHRLWLYVRGQWPWLMRYL